MLALTTFLLQEESAEEPEGIDLLIPNWFEFWAVIVAFAIIFFVVWKWALPALNRTLEARQEAISAQLREAETAKVEAESLLTDYRQQMAGAKEEANRIIEEARMSAEELRADTTSRAQAEADQLLAKARADAAAERERTEAALRSEVAALSLDMAEKVVAGSIDRSAQQALVERYLDELGGMES